MNKPALAALGLCLGAFAPSAWSQSNCQPGSILCASGSVTLGGGLAVGAVNVGIGVAAQPVVIAQPVVQQPVYVQPAQPTVVVQQPVYTQPQVVITPAPPVRYYVRPRPAWYYTTTTVAEPMYLWRSNIMVGGGAAVGAAYFGGRTPNQPGLIGLAAAVGRIRGAGHFGGEVSVGAAFGRDWNGDTRFEIPFTLSGLVYFNPQHRVQAYGVFGALGSLAGVAYSPANRAAGAHGGRREGGYAYVGGQLGLGLEYQVSSRFVLFADTRGFVRTRVDDNTLSNPEFAETLADGTTRTTNTSAGVSSQLGAIVYY
jgi:hypothetical protein